MEAKFLSPIDIRKVYRHDGYEWDGDDDYMWLVLADMSYQSALTGKTYTVPKGFLTNLASVPRMPIIFWLTGDTSHEAAAVHDYLYKTELESRSVSDTIMREASAVTGVAWWRRNMMWLGTRFGGGTHYGKGQVAAMASIEP